MSQIASRRKQVSITAAVGFVSSLIGLYALWPRVDIYVEPSDQTCCPFPIVKVTNLSWFGMYRVKTGMRLRKGVTRSKEGGSTSIEGLFLYFYPAGVTDPAMNSEVKFLPHSQTHTTDYSRLLNIQDSKLESADLDVVVDYWQFPLNHHDERRFAMLPNRDGSVHFEPQPPSD